MSFNGASQQAYYQTPGHTIAASVAFPFLTLLFVSLRFWIRIRHAQPIQTDDWLMVPATALTVGMGIVMLYGVSNNALATTADPPTEEELAAAPPDKDLIATAQVALMSKVEFAHSLMLPLALGCMKLSFLFFYRRIFAVHRKSAVDWLLTATIVLVSVWTCTFFFVTVFQCGVKVGALWGEADVKHCMDTLMATLAFCISDSVGDIIIIIIPIPLIWNLQLTTPKKFATVGIFLLGGVIIVASVCRLAFTVEAVKDGHYSEGDLILSITLYVYWGIVESGVGILAACLPTLAFLFRSSAAKSIYSKTRSMVSGSGNKTERSNSRSNNGKSIELQSSDTASMFSKQSPPRKSPPPADEEATMGAADVRESDSSSIRLPILGGNTDGVDGDAESVKSGVSELSRGSNRLHGDPTYTNSLATDTTWQTRAFSGGFSVDEMEGGLAPPPVSHRMRDFRPKQF